MTRTLLSGLIGGVMALSPALLSAGDEKPPPAGSEQADTEKLEAVLERKLDDDQRLAGSDIDVEVPRAGEVLLTGTVPSEPAHKRAVDLAQKTPGVTSVDDQLKVEIPN
jgi:osmotically-inducible protein OsmY